MHFFFASWKGRKNEQGWKSNVCHALRSRTQYLVSNRIESDVSEFGMWNQICTMFTIRRTCFSYSKIHIIKNVTYVFPISKNILSYIKNKNILNWLRIRIYIFNCINNTNLLIALRIQVFFTAYRIRIFWND